MPAWLFALLLVSSCRPPAGGEVDTSRPSEFGFQTSVMTSLEEEGRVAYDRYCLGCHGQTGDGNGEAARFFNPRPRNFVAANFKFSSTRSGQLPIDEDLKRTIREGLKGSAMPPFDLLPERTINALVAYVKTFSPKWPDRGAGTPIPIAEDPYRHGEDKTAAIQRGEAVYHGFTGCWNCHPSYVSQDQHNDHLEEFGNSRRDAFREGLEHAVGKPNTDGEVIFPPDFLRDFVRSGPQVADLYRVIGAGITGTAMPSWIDSMDIPGDGPGDPPLVTPADIWAMAYYVQDLIKQRPQKLAMEQVVLRDRHRPILAPGQLPEPVVDEGAGASGEGEFVEEEEFIEDE